MARPHRPRARWLIAGGSLLLVVALVVVAWPHVQRYTGAAPPAQFYDDLDAALAPGYQEVLGVAHNAGNNLETLSTALEYGADVIEVDVISARGQLVAGRDQPFPWLAEQLFRGPALSTVWDAAAPADWIKLDLKRHDQAFLDDIVAFVTPRTPERNVMISSRDGDALIYLHEQLPDVTMVFSAGFPTELQRVQDDPELQQAVGGLTVFQGLVDRRLVTWAHERNLLILAWTVNDLRRVNELVGMGVDGITTANLAILRILS